ncbi:MULTISPECIES: VOC family protein [Pseudonocardia]|uniref:Chlorohydroquinone/hydroquinone 1,2-dioxygenase n=2 Tax=Pseudonocardia TaxID=1847 RepID=A0A1Y2N2V9_PSEAH|nr:MULTISPECIES: VOC family protein [Pseudonocardia]OSY41792.1 Chlorohydroquinone/hydroquinone 1,2-dioxygenase [Pseudonocardia autotrophica]TDN71156.1 glyoxalase family protein [Pseudonocardia autotrophica]BBG01825.1 glyoxalase [Pseudonocardia autotrophica]GEC22991.1 glyoxalase [Pseudonocardia saturnea]
MAHVEGSHHVTLSVGHAQEDVDFHVKILGMRFIKRTVLFDGSLPIYHLYYSNADGDPSSVVTTFPWAQAGQFGTRGTNQAREVLLSVPEGSLDFWSHRLATHDVEVTDVERFDRRRLAFRHPSGIEYVFVPNTGDPRTGHAGHGVPPEHAIHGIHGVGLHVTTPDRMVEFADESFFAQGAPVEEGDVAALRIGDAKFGNHLEITVNRRDDQGTWRYGAGTHHHFAWNVSDLRNQDDVKFAIEGAGYTDISELKDRKYFKSVYVRTPAGALFELAVTHPEGGWTCDESPHELGSRFQLPEQFEHRREEIFGKLEPIVI